MPSVILLDLSLSMTRPVNIYGEDADIITRHQLAILGINAFLDYLAINCKLEFVSLVVYTSTYLQLVPFTRDYNEIKSALTTIKEWSKTFIETGLQGACDIIVHDWGFLTMSQVILITDSRLGVCQTSLMKFVKKTENRDNSYFFPFKFPNKLLIVCLSCASTDADHLLSCVLYSRLVNMGDEPSKGELFIPNKVLSAVSVRDMFVDMAKKHFVPFITTLKCGHLKSSICFFPPPYCGSVVCEEVVICGFLDGADVSSPSFLSRHLLFPTAEPNESGDKESTERMAAFSVLLHGSLKVEGMVAVVQLSKDWFGMLYSYADSKKKSNLTLSIFPHGSDSVPWLGEIIKMGPSRELDTSPYLDGKSPFPVISSDRKSYSQSSVVWIHNTGLQADIQKILRNARKLPEKQTHFYKELNRLRKAALSIGFFELFESLACLLERECTLLASNAHPGAALQMGHAASILRSPIVYDANQHILPLPTNFASE